MQRSFTFLNAWIQPDHAPKWPGKIIGIFKSEPMTYLIVYAFDCDGIVPFEWPKSIDEDVAKSLVHTLTHLHKTRDNAIAGDGNR